MNISYGTRQIVDFWRKYGKPINKDDIYLLEGLNSYYYYPSIIGHIKKALFGKKSNHVTKVVKPLKYYLFPYIQGTVVKARRKDGRNWSITGEYRRIYTYITEEYLIRDFSNKELLAIAEIATKFDVGEVMAGAEASKHCGVRHACYLRAILLGNREKAERTSEVVSAKRTDIARVSRPLGVPSVPLIQKKWQERLKAEQESVVAQRLKREAEKKK